MSNISYKLVEDAEERLIFLNEEVSKREQVLLNVKTDIEQETMAATRKQAELTTTTSRLDSLIASKKGELESLIKQYTEAKESLRLVEDQKIRLDKRISEAEIEITAKQQDILSKLDETNRMQSESKAEKELAASQLLEIQKQKDSLAEGKRLLDTEKKRLADYNSSIQERENKIVEQEHGFVSMSDRLRKENSKLESSTKELEEKQAKLYQDVTQVAEIKKNAELREKDIERRVVELDKERGILNADRLTLTQKETDLRKREEDYQFKLAEINLKEKKVKLKEKEFNII